jgi:hypothetical protein
MLSKFNKRETILFIWYGVLAALAAYVLLWWQFWTDLPSHGEMFASYKSILEGTYDVPHQYRYIAFLLPEIIRRVSGYSLQTSEAINRALWLWAFALAFHVYLRYWLGRNGAIIGVLGFFGVAPLVILQTSFAPSDIPTVFFQVLAFIALRNRSYAHLLWIAPIGILFRETMLYIFPVWLVMFLFEKDKRSQLPYLIGTIVITLIVYGSVRFYFGFRFYDSYLLPQNLNDSRSFIRPLLLFGILGILAWVNFKTAPVFLKYATILVPLVALAVFLYGYAKDMRLWFPLIPVVFPLGLRSILLESDTSSP